MGHYPIEILLPLSFMPYQLSALLELSPNEKLDIIEALWTSLNQSPELIPLPEWQQQELDRSKNQYDAHQESLLRWENVQASILANTANPDRTPFFPRIAFWIVSPTFPELKLTTAIVLAAGR